MLCYSIIKHCTYGLACLITLGLTHTRPLCEASGQRALHARWQAIHRVATSLVLRGDFLTLNERAGIIYPFYNKNLVSPPFLILFMQKRFLGNDSHVITNIKLWFILIDVRKETTENDSCMFPLDLYWSHSYATVQ